MSEQQIRREFELSALRSRSRRKDESEPSWKHFDWKEAIAWMAASWVITFIATLIIIFIRTAIE